MKYRSVSGAKNTLNVSHQKRRVLDTTPNCIWRWGSSPGDLRSAQFPFITITPSSTLPQNDRVSAMVQVYLFKSYLRSIGLYQINLLRNNFSKNVLWKRFLNRLEKHNPRLVDMPLKKINQDYHFLLFLPDFEKRFLSGGDEGVPAS